MPYMDTFVSYKLEIAGIPLDTCNILPFICRELSLLLLLLLYSLHIIRSYSINVAVYLSRMVKQMEKPERKVFVYALLLLSMIIQSAVNLR